MAVKAAAQASQVLPSAMHAVLLLTDHHHIFRGLPRAGHLPLLRHPQSAAARLAWVPACPAAQDSCNGVAVWKRVGGLLEG